MRRYFSFLHRLAWFVYKKGIMGEDKLCVNIHEEIEHNRIR